MANQQSSVIGDSRELDYRFQSGCYRLGCSVSMSRRLSQLSVRNETKMVLNQFWTRWSKAGPYIGQPI